MFLTNKQLPNVLFKAITLQEIANNCSSKITLECFDEELDYYDADKGINRFASIYALIAEKIPKRFEINSIGKHQFRISEIKNTRIRNPFLRFSNLPANELWFKIARLYLQRQMFRSGDTIFVAGDNGLINEILAKSGSHFEYIETYDKLRGIYDSAPLNSSLYEEEISTYFHESFNNSLDAIGLDRLFYRAFSEIALEIMNHKINKLISSTPLLIEDVRKLKDKYKASVVLCDGLYETPGLAISNAFRKNDIQIIAAEHGLTAGISKLRKNTINYCEPNTSDYILTYNEMASATFLSSSNKNLQCVECGAPRETKRLKNYLLQRAISRKRLKARSTAVFYVSTNLLANNNGFFPHYPPDHIRDRVETSLLKDVFPRLNKKVVYKYYPSQNYLYDKNPYVKLAEEIPNLVVSKEEDFRYIRTAADIILTSAPSSTLGWCIGAEKPIVYLDSPVYQPLENDLVSKVFDECFFVFNIDEQDWEERLLEFLNKSIDEIQSRWQKKSIYRDKYDQMYFLNKEKDAGAIGVNFIKSII
tara:strand:- start:4442 stop:6040 length:1599 start_codon:yes stop_codon:yes gene_type:complete